jgi:hypothetical protein
MNQMPKKRSTYRVLTSDTNPTAIMRGIIVPKSPKEPASSDMENFRGIAEVGDTVMEETKIRRLFWSAYSQVQNSRSTAIYTKIVYQSLK